jgi:hypothetical protein
MKKPIALINPDIRFNRYAGCSIFNIRQAGYLGPETDNRFSMGKIGKNRVIGLLPGRPFPYPVILLPGVLNRAGTAETNRIEINKR